MFFDLDQRTASLSVGEFSEFTLDPRDASGAPGGLWRAQLGTHWHNQLRAQTTAENATALFEIPITGKIFHHGWTLTLTGRIDQIIPAVAAAPLVLREIKTVTRAIPADETELRSEYPAYILQLAAYAALQRLTPENVTTQIRAELHFVEVSSGLSQTVTLTPSDDALFTAQLERVTEFLNLRHRARERLRNLTYRRPFAQLRPGQETTEADLVNALAAHPIILFEAPTGFGKTGVLLDLALSQMRTGRYERLIYLTSKATGQIQVMRTLSDMTAGGLMQNEKCRIKILGASPEVLKTPATDSVALSNEASFGVLNPKRIKNKDHQTDGVTDVDSKTDAINSSFSIPHSSLGGEAAVTAWLMRPKREHCIHTTFQCSRDVCPHLRDLETRWPKSGLARFYLLDNHPRDIETLRAAGRDVRICPYEITRAALPFNDVWIGDYNYIFAPTNRGIFTEQPGYDPARTLLVIDEAHNLPSRVADVYTHAFTADAVGAVSMLFARLRVPSALYNAWTHWEHFLSQLKATGAHPLAIEDDARELVETLSKHIINTPLDTEQIPPELSEIIWAIPAFANDLAALPDLPRLWWSPASAQLTITCLDAAQAIGPALREFAGVVLASATLTPVENFAAACGLDTPPGAPSSSSAPSNSAADRPSLERPAKLGALTKRDTKKLFAQLTTASDLLALDEACETAAPTLVRAHTPWRDNAYDVAIDARVDTTFQQRDLHAATTANAIAALAAASHGSVAVFFPSYAYAENIKNILAAEAGNAEGIFLQPRLQDLAAQNAWLTDALAQPGALFLVLGSSFAEGIDILGGRISHAMIVGPALPEVNAVQRARLATYAPLGRDAAARRVYQIPGIQKVNQALGRLVRAPGHRAKVLLHCRRFAEKNYHDLLAREYQATRIISTDTDLASWLVYE